MEAHADPPFLVVGHVRKAHGIRGEILVEPLTDHPDATFAPGVALWLGDGTGDRPDPDREAVAVETVRAFKGGLLVKLREVPDRSAAELLRGRYLLRPFEEAAPLEEGEVFRHELIGMAVVTVSGEPVGEVIDVFDLDPSDLLEVAVEGRTILVPLVSGVVTEVDADARRIVVDPPEGLLDL